jgi:hypothetical protein
MAQSSVTNETTNNKPLYSRSFAIAEFAGA